VPFLSGKFKVGGEKQLLISVQNQVQRLEEYAKSRGWEYEVIKEIASVFGREGVYRDLR